MADARNPTDPNWAFLTILASQALNSLGFSASKPNQTEVFRFGKTLVFRAAAPPLMRPPEEGPVRSLDYAVALAAAASALSFDN